MWNKRKLFFGVIKKSWIDEHLIAYFPFNNSLDDVVKDIRPTSYNAGWTSGKNGNAVDFNGTDSNYLYYNGDNFSFADRGNDKPFTIFGWFYWYSKGNIVLIMKRDSQNGDAEYQISTYNNRMYFMLFSRGNTANTIYAQFNIRTSLPTNQWFHFIATYGGCNNQNCIELYMDGIKINTVKRNRRYVRMARTNSELALANRKFANGFNYNGRMDGLGFLDIAVDDEMAMELYQRHLQGEIKY